MRCGRLQLKTWVALQFSLLLIIHGVSQAGEISMAGYPPIDINGFIEGRAGSRMQTDEHEGDTSVMEARVQTELFTYNDWADFKFKADVWLDGVSEKGEVDIREAWIFSRPFDDLDIKIGRQVLTWGTGDLVFLNDLFPKDWQSYFIGRDSEYLKAPSDAVKATFISKIADLDVIYTPQFDSDRYITGEYISYWNPDTGQHTGQGAQLTLEKPDNWFSEDELAIRLYQNISNYELALYGYWGYWKQPSHQTAHQSAFPRLNVYGASIRGQIAKGIGNIEFAYYDSAQYTNSELRYVIGYSQDLAMDLNASVQYYLEQLVHYRAYREHMAHPYKRDEFRHLITLQLTQLLMNQNLTLSFAGYYSPSDKDAYLRPQISYSVNDSLFVETGFNIFIGSAEYTFFGQFEYNTSAYAAVRLSF